MVRFFHEQLNTKTIKDVSADDLDTVFRDVRLMEINNDALQYMKLVKEVAGFQAGQPFKGTMSIKAVTLTGEGPDNAQIIHRPEPGQIWMCLNSMIEDFTADTGSQTFRLGTNDGSNYCIFIEMTSDVDDITLEPILNEQTTSGSREGGYNNPILYDYDNYLTVQYTQSGGTVSANPVINTQVVRIA